MASCPPPEPFLDMPAWRDFRKSITRNFEAHDHVVIRGLSAEGGGAGLMWATLPLASRFRTYRGHNVVKHFRMSPWTRDLSHTTRDGDFHTDLNTAAAPPEITAMQCLRPDPGGPGNGVSRVARYTDLVAKLRDLRDDEALSFLHDQEVEMVSDLDAHAWRGRIASENRIRFHPDTIRSAFRRYGNGLESVEPLLKRLHQAAMTSSAEINLGAGDVLIVSNHRALHYRGECSVRFTKFPREFETREVYVLHAFSAHSMDLS